MGDIYSFANAYEVLSDSHKYLHLVAIFVYLKDRSVGHGELRVSKLFLTIFNIG